MKDLASKRLAAWLSLFSILYSLLPTVRALAAEEYADVESYDAEASVFQKIADLEQEKVLMQLEKEKAQLQLDLDRLAAEQVRLAREQEGADMRAEEQAAEIEKQKLAVEQERTRLEEQKKKMAEDAARKAAANDDGDEPKPVQKKVISAAASGFAAEKQTDGSITDKYMLIEIVGAGNQLFATVENASNGKQKKLSVGKQLDGYEVRAISIDEGIELERDGDVVTLGVGTFGAGQEQ